MSKTHTYSVCIEVNLPAQRVWDLISKRYDKVSDYADQVVASRYVGAKQQAGEGAERLCEFNAKGTSYLREKMVEVDEAKMEYLNVLTGVKGFPMVPGDTHARFRVRPTGPSSCELSADCQARTKPAFLAFILKPIMRRTMRDFLLSVQYHLQTGEVVIPARLKEVRRLCA